MGWNGLVLALTPLLLHFFQLSPEAKRLVFFMVLINTVINGLFYPMAGPVGSGLRAAGDVTLTVVARLFFSVVFGLWLGWGVIGVTVGMSIDLVIRAALFYWRYRTQKWTTFQLI